MRGGYFKVFLLLSRILAFLVQWEIHSDSNLTTFPERTNHRYSSADFFFFLTAVAFCP